MKKKLATTTVIGVVAVAALVGLPAAFQAVETYDGADGSASTYSDILADSTGLLTLDPGEVGVFDVTLGAVGTTMEMYGSGYEPGEVDPLESKDDPAMDVIDTGDVIAFVMTDKDWNEAKLTYTDLLVQDIDGFRIEVNFNGERDDNDFSLPDGPIESVLIRLPTGTEWTITKDDAGVWAVAERACGSSEGESECRRNYSPYSLPPLAPRPTNPDEEVEVEADRAEPFCGFTPTSPWPTNPDEGDMICRIFRDGKWKELSCYAPAKPKRKGQINTIDIVPGIVMMVDLLRKNEREVELLEGVLGCRKYGCKVYIAIVAGNSWDRDRWVEEVDIPTLWPIIEDYIKDLRKKSDAPRKGIEK